MSVRDASVCIDPQCAFAMLHAPRQRSSGMRLLVRKLGILLLAASAAAQAADTPTLSNTLPASTTAPAQTQQAEAVDPDQAKAFEVFRNHRSAMLTSLSHNASPRDWALAQLL